MIIKVEAKLKMNPKLYIKKGLIKTKIINTTQDISNDVRFIFNNLNI